MRYSQTSYARTAPQDQSRVRAEPVPGGSSVGAFGGASDAAGIYTANLSQPIMGTRIRSLLAVTTVLVALTIVIAPPAVGIAASNAWNAGPHALVQPSTVLQSLPASCGPAVLATLTTWFGAPRSEAELIDAANLRAEGVTLSEFARLAHMVGLPGTWYSVPTSRLASVPTPFVAHLNLAHPGFGSTAAGLGHLVAVAAVAYGYVVVADPAVGTYVLSLERFSSEYSGRLFVLDGSS